MGFTETATGRPMPEVALMERPGPQSQADSHA